MNQGKNPAAIEEAKKILHDFHKFVDKQGQVPTPMQEAEDLIYGDREKTYGDPSKNLARIAEMWTAYLNKNLRTALERIIHTYYFNPDGQPVTPERLREISRAIDLNLSITDVCRMMQHLKQSRDENTPKRDNIVDDIGYAGLAHRCRTPAYERSIPTGVGVAVAGAGEPSKTQGMFLDKVVRKPPMKRKTVQSKSKRKAR